MRGAVLIAALVALASAARANDTQAVLRAGGLIFAKSAAVRIEREDLSIAPGDIRVRYLFRNLTAAPVTALIAFPLPDLDMGDLSETPHTFHFNGRDGDVVDFRLWVNGKPVAAALEARAVNDKDADITATLRALHIPLVGAHSDREALDALAALKPAAVRRLVAVGGAYPDEWTGSDTVKHPRWKVRAAYHWRQTFPPGTTVTIEHRYRPVMGEVLFDSFADVTADNALGALGERPDERRSWCATPGEVGAVGAGKDGRAKVQWVEYVLKTGANWAGPIGAFHLRIDPGVGARAFTCPIPGLALRRAGPALAADRVGFTPTSDIAVMFLSSGGPVPHLP
ncbi:MAG TPA: DUF4424 family protein [Caulobacteraceae bacterium]